MQYSEMEPGFQHAFAAAINAYRRGSTPIGCAVTDGNGFCVSKGENSIYSNDKIEIINNHHLAHAEINAILKLNRQEHRDISSYILYTTMEPCALCFGAVVMSYLKQVRFAAIDKYSGAVCLNSATAYIKEQNIRITGPFEPLQDIQIALLVHRRLALGFPHNGDFIELYRSYCENGVALGVRLSGDQYFTGMLAACDNPELIVNYMFTQLQLL
jgi:tRNA(Arg) A34 adenosine deaminase TadA